MFTLSGFKVALKEVTICPDLLNSLSEGELVAHTHISTFAPILTETGNSNSAVSTRLVGLLQSLFFEHLYRD